MRGVLVGSKMGQEFKFFFYGYFDRWGNGVLRAFGWAGAMSLFYIRKPRSLPVA
jgi:hypothetical protein